MAGSTAIDEIRTWFAVRITRQAMYVSSNNELRLCNLCCSGKAMSITYSECVFVALGVQHSICMRHIIICGLSGSTIFYHISHKGHNIRKSY
jgi:hypothetical protein